MSVEIVERLFDAVHRNDVQSYVKCFAEDAEYKIANFPPVYGRKDIEAFGARITPMFERVLHDVKHTWQMGNTCVSEMDVVKALEGASTGPVQEGTVGAGTGMVSYGFKGGIGTASRKLPRFYPDRERPSEIAARIPGCHSGIRIGKTER